jgi:homoserine dehydrogenase
MSQENIETKYYMRMHVKDEKGVLAKITTILGDNDISIDSFLQKPEGSIKDRVTLLFATHTCKEKDIKNALSKIESLDFVLSKPFMIRIEE